MAARLAEGMRVSTPKGEGTIVFIDERDVWIGRARTRRDIWITVKLDSGDRPTFAPRDVEPVA